METFYITLFLSMPFLLAFLLYRFWKRKIWRIILIFLLLLVVSFDVFAVVFTMNFDRGMHEKMERREIEAMVDYKKLAPETYEVGFIENFEKLPQIKIDSATEADFSALKPQVSFVKNNVKRKGGYFFLPTLSDTLKFRDYDAYSDYGSNGDKGSEYFGFSSDLNLYAVIKNWIADDLGFAEFSLIDKASGNRFKINSLGDDAVSVPVLSPSKNLMVYWQNPEYGSGYLQIAVLKINDKIKPETFLKEYAYAEIKNFEKIEEIRWKDNQNFVIKTYKSTFDEAGNEVKNIKYLLGKIDSNLK